MKHNIKKGPNKETLDTFKEITHFSNLYEKLKFFFQLMKIKQRMKKD